MTITDQWIYKQNILNQIIHGQHNNFKLLNNICNFVNVNNILRIIILIF